ncbi:MAG TPA: MFS transporter [Acidimicrobiales bacterium]|nr:MFS transporter [Acidimicrobiales bacterium]
MRRSLRPVAIAFAVFGAFWGSWAIAAIDVERFLRVSHAGLGTVLAVAVIGGTVANAVGGTLAERHGTRLALTTWLLAWAASLGVLVTLHHRASFIGVFVLSVAVGGGVDVVMNVAASAAMADRPGGLLRFHALFNGGAVVGAGITALLVHGGVSWRVVWAGIAVLAVVLALDVARTDLPAGEPGEPVSIRDGLAALGRAGLVRLAFVFALAALVEGGIDTWGVLFLRSRLAIGVLAGAAAYVAGQSLATTARATAGGWTRGVHSGRGASTGAVLAAAGLLTEALSPVPVVAGIGLAAAAVGISMCWPLFLSEATAGEERPALIVGGITAAGYVGFVAGPPVVGWVSSVFGLRVGLVVLAAAALACGTLPRKRAVAPRSA